MDNLNWSLFYGILEYKKPYVFCGKMFPEFRRIPANLTPPAY
jgi:hypothetical protein